MSLTAEQLLCQPWWELSARPTEIVAEFPRLAVLLISGECTETLASPAPPHGVQELQSHEMLTLNMEVRYVSPLRQSGMNAGFLVVTRSQITGSRSTS